MARRTARASGPALRAVARLSALASRPAPFLRAATWTLVVVHCATVRAVPPGRSAPEEAFAGNEPALLRIVVLPAAVTTGSVVRLRVEMDPPSPTEPDKPHWRTVHWRTESGVLLFEDLAETSWRAPPREGAVTVRVAVTTRPDAESGGCGDTLCAERAIAVRRPSTDGMIWIPEGSFTRGDVEGTADLKEVKTIQNSSDEPSHQVHLSGYWIDRYPVTNRKYVSYLEDALNQGMVHVTPLAVFGYFEGSWVPFYYFQSYEELVWEYLDTVNARVPEFLHLISWNPERRSFAIRAGHENAPVVDVSWFGASAYARFHGKSLPTEAQWEKAARGPDVRKFPWGDHLPTAYHVNLNHYRGEAPVPVGTFSPQGDSPYGVGDMAAGLFEWTSDWFNATYYEDYCAQTPLRDPTGPFWGKAHSIRSFPSAILHTGSARNDARPVSSRYHWRFEFFVRDIFANRTTTFRTVVCPPAPGYEYEDDF